MKKIISVFLVALLIIAMVPTQAFAAEKKEVTISSKVHSELTSIKKTAKKYGWMVECKLDIAKCGKRKSVYRLKFSKMRKNGSIVKKTVYLTVSQNKKGVSSKWTSKDARTGKTKTTSKKLLKKFFKKY